jgi:hypothetical protein
MDEARVAGPSIAAWALNFCYRIGFTGICHLAFTAVPGNCLFQLAGNPDRSAFAMGFGMREESGAALAAMVAVAQRRAGIAAEFSSRLVGVFRHLFHHL